MTALRRQRGAALLIMITIAVLGFVTLVVAALGKSEVTRAERDARTALALQKGKNALLSHVAHYAARSAFDFPGRMPCPEALDSHGGPNAGEAPGNCSNTSAVIGRLPWKTLGIEQLRDGDGEPLWYVLSPNFHPSSFPLNPTPPNPYLNFGTPAALPFEGTNVVAVVIAPGRALASNPCNAVNQMGSRYVTPLDPLNFFECGNATGAYASAASTSGSNDRVLAITSAEWAAAITGPVADRLQREVAPALADFLMTESNANWGRVFLPYASTFTNPATNNLCGNNTVREGLTPAALSDSSTCTSWTGGTVDGVLGLKLDNDGCSQVAGVGMRCQFRNLTLAPLITARIQATARNVGGSFRRRIAAGPPDITSPQGGAVWDFHLDIEPKTGDVNLDFKISFPLINFWQMVTVDVRNLPDANIVNDDRARWFFKNEWGRHTYYAISKGDRLAKADDCSTGKKSDCLKVVSFPAANGSNDDKHFVLGLMGPALSGQTRPSNVAANYVEFRTANSPDEYRWQQPPDATYNDRPATCPFRYTDANGVLRTLC